MTDTSSSAGGGKRRSESRVALYAGLAGAIIGGAASFGGTYFTTVWTRQAEHDDTARQAFVDVYARGAQFSTDLYELAENPKTYVAVRRRLVRQNGPLHAAIANVRLLTDGDAAKRADQVATDLFKPVVPIDPRDVDSAALKKAVKRADGSLEQFADAARLELDR